MNIEFKFTVDTDNGQDMGNLLKVISSLSGAPAAQPEKNESEPDPVQAEEAPKAKARKEKAVKPAPEPEKEQSEQPEQPEQEETAPEQPEENGIKIEDVRALLAMKVENNRVGIKSKLDALGARNVTSLAKEKYAEFYAYLQSLK